MDVFNEGANQATPPIATELPQGEQPPAKPSGVIPYNRFAEVVAQKNQSAAEVLALKEQVKNLAGAITGEPTTNVAPLPQFDSAESLVAYIAKQTDERVNAKIGEAEGRLHERDVSQTFKGNVENYFSTNQNASQLRNEMDAYTAGLSQSMQNAIKLEVADGNTRMLDAIFSQVANENQEKIKGLANQNTSRQARNAISPDPFKTIRTGQPTFQDSINEARQSKNFTSVWGAVAQDAGVYNR